MSPRTAKTPRSGDRGVLTRFSRTACHGAYPGGRGGHGTGPDLHRWTGLDGPDGGQVLVNNAAVAITKPFSAVTDDDFDRSFTVNVKGVFHGLKLAWDHLADGGRIITISSSTTALMLPGYALYDATKGAVEQFTRILAKEFGPRGITVNAVSPGATETETYRAGKSEQFLAGDAAGWVTAQNIRVNGGTA